MGHKPIKRIKERLLETLMYRCTTPKPKLYLLIQKPPLGRDGLKKGTKEHVSYNG